MGTESKQERSEVEERLPEDKLEMSEFPKRVVNQMRAEAGALFPGLPQGSIGSPTLVLGSFSLITMPMPGTSNVLQHILPLLQKLPNPTQLFSGAAADLSKQTL
jgi:hypothetical protein